MLLVRFEFPDVGTVWAMPGGGVDPGESIDVALRRELIEEIGLEEPEVGQMIWSYTRIIATMGPHWGGQVDRVFLVRTPRFEPTPALSWEQLNAERVYELRWWPIQDVISSPESTRFAPRCLPSLLGSFAESGPPAGPIRFGE